MNPVTVQSGDSPVILGLPHGGTFVPEKMFERLNQRGKGLDDTDWHISRLYEGLLPDVTTVAATFHRYVIDANRNPEGVSLYPGQNTTGLCPLTDFDGNSIWREGQQPSADEIGQRRLQFHQPYHDAMAAEIERVRTVHGYAILYDCHSIRSNIPFLFEGLLPIFNIGTNDSTTCAAELEQAVRAICREAAGFDHVLNGRFKGGWTTRHYGRPEQDVHAIQMEIAQRAYMNEQAPWAYSYDLADQIRPHLSQILRALAACQIT